MKLLRVKVSHVQKTILMIGMGGFLGSVLRYAVSLWSVRLLGVTFPYGTVMVNVFGSFLLGVMFTLGDQLLPLSPNLRIAIGTGFLGAFTTFSTFSVESLTLLRSGQTTLAAVNVFVNVAASLAAAYGGMSLMR